MKKLIIAVLSLTILSCGTDVKKDYVTFSGKIENKNSDSIVVSTKGYSKTIQVSEDGSFSDTLKVTPGLFRFYDGGEYARLFLRNGFDLNMTLNTEEFDESIKFSGEGSENNNFIAENALKMEELFDLDVEELSLADLDQEMKQINTSMTEFINSKPEVDSIVSTEIKKSLANNIKGYQKYLGELIQLRQKLPKGTVSPLFENYENHDGTTTSLADLKGAYVYIDVWATWCGPCKMEIPFLKEVENDYHDKNIQFVSISIDREKDHQKWIDMVNDKQLGGIQLYADSDWNSKFVKDYYISGIPRFILIDPDGNIVTPDAPRPSNPKLREMLDELI